MSHKNGVAAHWKPESKEAKDFEEASLQQWAEQLRGRLEAPEVTLGLIFIAPRFFDRSAQILEIVRVHAKVPLLVGCSSGGLIAGGEEIEEGAGITLGLYHLPGAKLETFHFRQDDVETANGPGFWRMETEIEPEDTNGWLIFADPFTLDADSWLQGWNEAYAGLPVLGGLAGGDFANRTSQLYLNGEVLTEGLLAVAVGGEVGLAGVISQGCTPIGETWTITKAEENLIHEIGNRPAYEVLAETFAAIPEEDQKKAQGNLFVGLVVNEYLEDFHRGDFLVRNLLGADPNSGILAVGAFPRPGQTMQFQRRDGSAANEDMVALLDRAVEQLKGVEVLGGCLCSCNGRGSHLFGYPSHDAGLVQKKLGPLAVAGFFCNGEIGPIGEKNFLHGYTAALALFVRKEKK